LFLNRIQQRTSLTTQNQIEKEAVKQKEGGAAFFCLLIFRHFADGPASGSAASFVVSVVYEWHSLCTSGSCRNVEIAIRQGRGKQP
jgi:hypothetical protein